MSDEPDVPPDTMDPSDEDQEESLSSEHVLERLQRRIGKESRYQIQGEFARGGMGAILKVWDRDLRRTLAMKIVLSKGDEAEKDSSRPIDERSLGRFLEEAQVTGQLDHPGIVPVHELGIDSCSQVYFTMRLVKGTELGDVFDRVREGKDGWTHARAMGTLLKVCETMAYAHARGVIHRDLKPSNVMVGSYGEVYVMDWGLARVLAEEDHRDLRPRSGEPGAEVVQTDRHGDSTHESPLRTMDGDVIGTPAYMSPEQARGELSAMGPASDVYAVGAILYHLLAGHMPYAPTGSQLDAYDVWKKVREDAPTPLAELAPDAPVELVAICERAMAREIGNRYPDMGAMAADLQAYVEGRVVSAHEAGTWAEARKWMQRNRGWTGSMVAAVALLVVGLAVSLFFKQRSDENAEEAAAQTVLAKERAVEAFEEANRARRIQSLFLAEHVHQQIAGGDVGTALALGLEGLPRDLGNPDRPHVWELESALHVAVGSNREQAVLEHESSVNHASWSHDGSRLVTASVDKTARIWDSEGRPLAVLEGHGSSVQSAVWSPDGSRLLTGSRDGTARIWEATGRHLVTLDGHEDEIKCVAWSPDGSRLATASGDKTARLWSADGSLVATLEGHEGRLNHVSWKPDSSAVVTSSLDETARIWDREGQPIAVLDGDVGQVNMATWSPDGSRLLTAAADHKALIWKETGQHVATLAGHEWTSGWHHRAVWSPDGKRIVTPSADRTARVWDAAGNLVTTLTGHEALLNHAAWSPDGTRLVTASQDHTARVWSWTGRLVAKLVGHRGSVVHVAWSPEGTKVVTTSHDGTARIWKVAGQVLTGDDTAIVGGAWSPSGSHIVTTAENHTARLWDGEGMLIATLAGHRGSKDMGLRATWNRDGSRLVTTANDEAARIWDRAGRLVADLEGHEKKIRHAAWSPDGSKVVTSSLDGTARVWDADGELVTVLTGHEDGVSGASWSPDGTRLATLSWDGTARLWTPGGDAIATLPNEDFVYSAVWAPDASLLITTSVGGARLWTADGRPISTLWDQRCEAAWAPDGSRFLVMEYASRTQLWDREGRHLATLGTHGQGSAAWSPDGARIALAYPNRILSLWTAEGQLVVETVIHDDGIQSVSWSPDGTRFVTASVDGTARVWDADGGRLAVLVGHLDRVRDASWSPDGTKVLTASADGTARIWPIFTSGQALIDHALAVRPRELTATQRTRFFLDVD